MSKSQRLNLRDTYENATKECDVVMKGGITSGVLYPLAVCELATEYHLRSVGGTSAGAIAAAAAAAAEYGRLSDQPGSGFDGLAALPEWLGSDDHLVNLFQPSDDTEPFLSLLLDSMHSSSWATSRRILGTALSLPRWWIPVLAVSPALLIITTLAATSSSLAVPAIIAAAGLGALLLIVGAVVAIVLDGGESLAKNGYGLVSGSNGVNGAASVSDWLTEIIDELAGIGSADGPLTFGQLWSGSGQRMSSDPANDPMINLEMQTTSVTEGRPYRLPDDLGGSFAFSKDEFRRIFPDRVVDHLVERAGGELSPGGLIPMPPAFDLPVVVATRMSLSFPLLMSAVPLHSVDRSSQEGETEVYERCWFSDGGITSNFPVSYFDALLPSRPTFGINLRPFHPRHDQSPDECDNVWMPIDNTGGFLEWWTRWPADAGFKSVVAFLRAIADTMQNWVDNQQTRVPGFRDRIIHISHADDEGGMNLAMPRTVLNRLSERGRCAGARLVEYYTSPPESPDVVGDDQRRRVVSWENHRWIRLRTALGLTSDFIESMATGMNDDYSSDLAADLDGSPGYPFRNLDQQALGRALIHGVSEPGEGPRVELPVGLVDLATAIRAVEVRGASVPSLWGVPARVRSSR